MEMDGWMVDEETDRRVAHIQMQNFFSSYKPWLTPDLLGTMGPRWPLRGSCTALEALAKAIGIFGSSEEKEEQLLPVQDKAFCSGCL